MRTNDVKKRERVAALILSGKTRREIIESENCGPNLITDVKKDIEAGKYDYLNEKNPGQDTKNLDSEEKIEDLEDTFLQSFAMDGNVSIPKPSEIFSKLCERYDLSESINIKDFRKYCKKHHVPKEHRLFMTRYLINKNDIIYYYEMATGGIDV